ncbi:hypothetical protein FS842_000920 [Serendipita sp. 407]|nr:hypothetical protein FS842_000920 [Serendipita sp. 407]
METRKMFVIFLALATIAVPLLVFPVYRPLWEHAVSALSISRDSEVIRSYWWDHWWSWILFAGPIGRWPVGTALGFRLLRARQDHSHLPTQAGYMIGEPNVTVFVIVQVAAALACFTAILLMLSVRDVLKGQTTFDRLIASPHGITVWIPERAAAEVPGRVLNLPQGVIRLYDLGYRRNWADLMERPLFGLLRRDRDVIPTVNEEVLLVVMARQRIH